MQGLPQVPCQVKSEQSYQVRAQVLSLFQSLWSVFMQKQVSPKD